MASIIPGYEYDIFISCRQKDNKGDRWVSEFVEALKTEPESTFKEEIRVYFDINPHDGLLETHDVDASLKDKLKCLIFIPIISRTYCDPKSFACEHEFKAFIKQASTDQFGLKVKLPNLNVVSRILPVQIHDLEAEDKKMLGTELGGVVRAIEFVYKEPGVNRSLNPGDEEQYNVNKTKYTNQIYQVALAIKEIIHGTIIKSALEMEGKDRTIESVKKVGENDRKIDLKEPDKTVKSNLLSTVALFAILIVAGILAYPMILKRSSLDKLRSSGEKITVAVMPFQKMKNDTTWNVWQNGIQNELITSLMNSEELKVRQTGSIKILFNTIIY